MKKLLAVLLVCALSLGLWGCQQPDTEQTPTYGLVLRCDDPYRRKMEEGFRQAAETLGVTVIAEYADGTAEDQIRIIEDMIAKGIQGLAISAADGSSLKNTLEKAKNAGIGVVTVDADTEGSQVFVNQADMETVARTLLDSVLELTGGDGEFAVISSDVPFSGSDPFVNSMEHLIREEKYKDLIWVETLYGDTVAVSDLLQSYPELETICCLNPELLPEYCKELEKTQANLKVTGLGNPSTMADFVGNNRVCSRIYFWNPVEMGQCAAYALEGLLTGKIGDPGTSFTAENGMTYNVTQGFSAEKTVVMNGPYCFDEENIHQWADVY